MSEAPVPGMERLTLVVLRRPADATNYPEEELDRIQAGHIAFLDEQRERGVLAVAGPFRDHEDESLRGLCVYRTGVEETRAIIANDPALRANRMSGEVVTWWFREGEVGIPEA
jgi:uncharacterized protein YciI